MSRSGATSGYRVALHKERHHCREVGGARVSGAAAPGRRAGRETVRVSEQRRPLGPGPRQTPAPDGPVRHGRLAAELAALEPAVPPDGKRAPQAALVPQRRALGAGGIAST